MKLLNTTILVKTYKNQVNIYMYRRCRQGDPISSSIFILYVELLAIRIRHNKLIKGITLNYQIINIILSRFADDTTVILDDIERSLKKVLEEITNFGKS